MIKINKVKDSYILNLPSIYNGYYMVNEEKVTSGVINLLEEPKSIFSHQVYNKLYQYTNSDGDILSLEDYQKREKELESKGYENEEGTLEFVDVEDEINYKRFQKNWKPEYQQQENVKREEYEIIEIPDSPNPYIKGFRTIGKGLEPLFSYTPNPVAMFKEITAKFGFTEVPDISFGTNILGKYYSIPGHSGIEFAKVNNKYLFTGNNKITFYGITGTYQECEDRFNSEYQKIYDAIKQAYLVLENKELNNFQTQWVIEVLTHIKENIYKIDPMKKSYDDLKKLQTYITTQLRKFIDVQS